MSSILQYVMPTVRCETGGYVGDTSRCDTISASFFSHNKPPNWKDVPERGRVATFT